MFRAVKCERTDILKNILVVDNSMTSRLILRRMMERTGFRANIIEAADGVEAYSILAHYEKKMDLIITSLTLPKMSGITLLKKIRATPGLKMIPLVVITVSGREEIEKQLDGCNLAGFIGKPLEYDSFIEAAGGYL